MDKERFAARGGRFALATPHRAATEAGLEAFFAGGNAVDAALAASTVLAVVYPHMCGIGGDLFAVIADSQRREVVNGSGAAAEALDAELVRRRYGSMPTHGPLSVSVPGTIAAWDALARQFGRLPVQVALRKAAGYAADGVEVPSSLARALVRHRERIITDSGIRDVLFANGRPLREGDTLRQPALAATLRAIADGGPASFYDGDVGRRFLASLKRMGSPLSIEDFRRHATDVASPIARSYRGMEVLVPPPNSQGFVLPEILNAVERAAIDADHLGPEAPVMSRLFLLASSDRDQFLADPRRVPVPVRKLLSSAHSDELIARARAGAMLGGSARSASGDTVGIVAAEAEGLWVSMNQSIYDVFGAALLEPETGILCHNRGSYFSLDAHAPNRLEGGKRPAHTLMPVIVLNGGAPAIASATMGGSAHAQIHAELLMAVIDQQRDPLAAIDRPRWLVGGIVREGGPGVVAESRVPGGVVTGLRSAGIDVDSVGAWDEAVGHANLLTRSADGSLIAAADRRADGAATAG